MMYVTRLNVLPDSMMTNCVPMDCGYWIMNGYGINLEISAPVSVELSNLAFISEAMDENLESTFYVRGDNAEIAGWKIGSDESGEAEPGASGSVMFDDINPTFTSLGQLIAVRDSVQFGRPQVAIVHESDTVLYQRGGSSMALAIQGGAKGLLLPRYTSVALQNVPSPMVGSIVFVTDLKQIACYDGGHWQLLNAEYLQPPVFSGLPEITGVSLAGGSTASALLSLGSAAGVLIVPSFTGATSVNIDYPKEGLLIYRSDLDLLAYYDGIDWRFPTLALSTLTANTTETTQNLTGIRIGAGVKDPNALLHIIDPERALGIPVVHTDDIQGPHAGLIVFDPALKMLCLFDGVGWQTVK
jgi:hypothetical protein